MLFGVVDRLRPYFQRRPRPGHAPPPAQPAAAPPQATPATAFDSGELSRRRDQLGRQLTELQWDLGGLTYEMAIRDSFRLDLLVRRAAALQEVDVELAAVDRLLQMGPAGAAGSCPTCGALYSGGATYCWRCGKALGSPGPVTTAAAPTMPSAAPPPATQPPAA